MSDVLIKGMEMPKSCRECRFDSAGWCFATDRIDNRTRFVKFATYDSPQEWCPLVPVPPHGRLIDADALADVFRGFIAMYDSCPFSQLAPTDKARRDELQAALAEVINATTIIPSEDSRLSATIKCGGAVTCVVSKKEGE